jgi:HK97 gp10 family phage protein
MPTGVTIKIEGLKELDQRLKTLPDRLMRRTLRKVLSDAGNKIRKAIVDRASRSLPGRKDRPSGFLKSHFAVKVRLNGQNRVDPGGEVFVGPEGRMYYPDIGSFHANKRGRMVPDSVSTGKNPKKGGVLPVASVARFLEFGTSRAPAHPFMGPAFRSVAQSVLEQIKTALSDELKRLGR